MSEQLTTQSLSTVLAALGVTPEVLAQTLVAQGVLVDVRTTNKVAHTTADGRTIQVTPKQKARFDAQAAAKAANPRPTNTFYQDVIVGGREARANRKARNKALSAALDKAQPGWRGLPPTERAKVWEAAQQAAQQVAQA
jgi:acyl-CoA reductase-like NAD-dependent aldehyde dehydrogenase